jgi:beta-lactamase class C
MIKNFGALIIVVVAALISGIAGTTGSVQLSLGKQMIITDKAKAPVLDSATLALVDNYDQYVRESITAEQFPGAAVVIVKDGAVVFSKGYGVRDLNTRDSVNEHTVFRLASLSKGFASVLAGILVKDELFSWDDPVQSYLSDFRLRSPEHTEALTIRHVLSHTTGLPRQTYSNLIEAGDSYTAARRRLGEVRMPHAPGTIYNYQNVAYSLIGEIAEKTAGRRYEELLYRRIFLPLGMTDAGAGYANLMLDPSNIAKPHKIEKQSYKRIDIKPNYYEVSPAAGVNASISDMGKWLLFLMGQYPEVLGKEDLEALYAKQIAVPLAESNHRSYPNATEAWYGLGWRGVRSNGKPVIHHGGYVNGYRTEIAFIPSENIGIAVLTNAPSWFINSASSRFLTMYWGLPNDKS